MSRVGVDIELVGGELDGRRYAMPDARPSWRIPTKPPGGIARLASLEPDELLELDVLTYSRVGHRDEITEHGATRVLIYELEGPS